MKSPRSRRPSSVLAAGTSVVALAVAGSLVALGSTAAAAPVASTATFTVDRVATYPKTRFPTALVYGSLDVAGLRLITCGGFDPVVRAYEANVIVFSTLAPT